MSNHGPESTPEQKIAAKPRRRWFIMVVVVLSVALAMTPLLDDRADQNYERLFQRALVTFALARTLNGVISAMQGTEVALQPAGVGVTLTPGEMLDPVNDLVERFSWIMLGATVSLGIQSVLLDFSAFWVLKIAVAVLALWLLMLYWFRDFDAPLQRQWVWRALLITIFLRFAVPLTLVANEAIYDIFLEPRYDESTEVIRSAGEALEQLNFDTAQAPEAAEDETIFSAILGPLGNAWDSAAESLNLGDRVEAIQSRAAEMIEHLIQLSVVFVLQTGILPIAFLWLFLQLAKWLMRPLSRQE